MFSPPLSRYNVCLGKGLDQLFVYIYIVLKSSDIKKAHFTQQAQFPHPGSIFTSSSISTAVTLKSVILFQFDFKKSTYLGKKESHFCLVYGKVY